MSLISSFFCNTSILFINSLIYISNALINLSKSTVIFLIYTSKSFKFVYISSRSNSLSPSISVEIFTKPFTTSNFMTLLPSPCCIRSLLSILSLMHSNACIIFEISDSKSIQFFPRVYLIFKK